MRCIVCLLSVMVCIVGGNVVGVGVGVVVLGVVVLLVVIVGSFGGEGWGLYLKSVFVGQCCVFCWVMLLLFMEIYDDILGMFGNMLFVCFFCYCLSGNFVVKVEMFNLGLSVKDCIGVYMIDVVEVFGEFQLGGMIVELILGNIGFGFVIVVVLCGYKLICMVVDKIFKEKVCVFEFYGVEVIICLMGVEVDDLCFYYKVVECYCDEEGVFFLYQYYNQNNFVVYYVIMGFEVWCQIEGMVMYWVVGMGMGGMILGMVKYFKEQNLNVCVVGVDMVGSVYVYYCEYGELLLEDQIYQYVIDGIGEDFMFILVWWDYIDEVIMVEDKLVYQVCFELVCIEGIFVGLFGGVVVVGVKCVVEQVGEGFFIVIFFLDSGECYLLKFDFEWMVECDLF